MGTPAPRAAFGIQFTSVTMGPPSVLRYVDDTLPGITRRKRGRAWAYFDAGGERITDRDEIDRLNRIALPPAYRDAWFCPHPHGHIQAIGWDEKGRKQYRYHLDFRSARESAKYERCPAFGRALPKLRARVEEDLAGRRLTRDTVIAAVVRLLDLGKVRVGNEAYAQANESFGATTLRDEHARITRGTLRLEYRGKSGKTQKLTIQDARLARIAKRCQDLDGQVLFQYVGSDGEPHPVGSGDVNAYIKEAMKGDFTAKHFRTWGASVLAYQAIVDAGEEGIRLKQLLEPVAKALGNTPAISRKSYVHPALIEIAAAGGLRDQPRLSLPRATRYLSPPERGLIAFLDAIAGAPARGRAEAA